MPILGLLILAEDNDIEPGTDTLVRGTPGVFLLAMEEVETIAGRGWVVLEMRA